MTPTPIAKSALRENDIYHIGLVAAEWNYAETIVQLVIWTLAGIDHSRGRIITTHTTTVINADMARTLANELLVDQIVLRDEILDVLKSFDSLRIKRNTIVHAYWVPKSNPEWDDLPEYAFAKARGELKVGTHSLDEDFIRVTVGEITGLIGRLTKVLRQLPQCPIFKAIEITSITADQGTA
jgi:hypothetical protein